jgi:hypothetical protein
MSESKVEETSAPHGGLLRTLILLIGNLLPLAGVVLWGWDAFLLLMLYWMETVIVAFWTVVQIRLSAPGAAGTLTANGVRKVTAPGSLAAFFALHSGLFIGVHLLFLWVLFSGDWYARTGFFGFFTHAIGAEALWIPLLFLFFARGAMALNDGLWRRQRRPDSPEAAEKKMDGILIGLYGRIVAMQIAIIAGAWFARAIGSIFPLILLIVCKTAAELLMQGPGLRLLNAPPSKPRAP